MTDRLIDTPAEGSARRAIFERLHAAMTPAPMAAPDLEEYYGQSKHPPVSERAAQFAERARAWRAEVIETTAAQWPSALLAVLDAKRVRRLLAGPDTALSRELSAALAPERLCWYDRDIEQLKSTLFDAIDAGITTTLGGIVETGTLILWPSSNEPRSLSLVPSLHIAVLYEDQLHPTLFAAMRMQNWSKSLPTNAVLVTGPSKTADIQRLLVYGAHGPQQLVILLVKGGSGA